MERPRGSLSVAPGGRRRPSGWRHRAHPAGPRGRSRAGRGLPDRPLRRVPLLPLRRRVGRCERDRSAGHGDRLSGPSHAAGGRRRRGGRRDRRCAIHPRRRRAPRRGQRQRRRRPPGPRPRVDPGRAPRGRRWRRRHLHVPCPRAAGEPSDDRGLPTQRLPGAPACDAGDGRRGVPDRAHRGSARRVRGPRTDRGGERGPRHPPADIRRGDRRVARRASRSAGGSSTTSSIRRSPAWCTPSTRSRRSCRASRRIPACSTFPATSTWRSSPCRRRT